MTRESAEQLVEFLRGELTAHGHLLAQYDRQQRGRFSTETDGMLEYTRSMEAAIRSVDQARTEREACVRRLAIAGGLPVDTNLRQLVRLAPDVFRPMLESFAREINRLVHAVRRRSRQNRSIPSRAHSSHVFDSVPVKDADSLTGMVTLFKDDPASTVPPMNR